MSKDKKYKLVGVRFVSGAKVYYFDPGKFDLKRGDYVVVENQQGEDLARVVYEPAMLSGRQVELEEIMSVVRIAVDDDKIKTLKFHKDKKEYLDQAGKMSNELGLEIRFIDVTQSLDESHRLLFMFAAEGRVDFRDLLTKMSKKFNCSIRLYQVGPRDAARIVGGVGVCGQQLCCKRFLNKFESITMEMAREQDLVNVGSNKISGVCGKLLCCLSYELKLYKDLKKNFVPLGARIKVDGEIGIVVERNVLMQTVIVETGSGIKKVCGANEVELVDKV
ncbi:stage 0 sporulation protein [Patescibacteria group bacterium]|nr:stage 0 sporulation protein [Patescibacteria group bacterium]